MPITYTLPRLSLLATLLVVSLQGTALASDNTSAHEQEQVNETAAQAMLKEQQGLEEEAMTANMEIFQAVVSLSKNDKDGAYKALSDASGKLDVVLSRDPHMKHVPIAVHVTTKDLESGPDAVKATLTKARKALDAGQIQNVRSLLKPLTSEIRITTDYLPMDTYPAEIKTATSEIQAGHSHEAARRLVATLATVGSNEKVIPLPPLKAETDVQEADELIQADKVKNRQAALDLLTKAKAQLEVGKLLGYGNYKDITKEMDTVKEKITGGSWDQHLFDRVKSLLKEAKAKI